MLKWKRPEQKASGHQTFWEKVKQYDVLFVSLQPQLRVVKITEDDIVFDLVIITTAQLDNGKEVTFYNVWQRCQENILEYPSKVRKYLAEIAEQQHIMKATILKLLPDTNIIVMIASE